MMDSFKVAVCASRSRSGELRSPLSKQLDVYIYNAKETQNCSMVLLFTAYTVLTTVASIVKPFRGAVILVKSRDGDSATFPGSGGGGGVVGGVVEILRHTSSTSITAQDIKQDVDA